MTVASAVDHELLEMMRTVFGEHRAAQERRDPGHLDTRLWGILDQVGLTRLTGAASNGGSGGSWREAGALLGVAAGHAARVPLAEHDLLAGWLLDEAGLEPVDAPMTAAVLDGDGWAEDVPWASQVPRIVVAWKHAEEWLVADLPTAGSQMTVGSSLAGVPHATLRVETSTLVGTPVAGPVGQRFFLRAALVRSLQICGALEKIVDLCVRHTTERTQFGQPLARFQAVQHLVADAAAESSLARAATDAALAEAVDGDFASPFLAFAVAVARSCTGHAAGTLVRNAHQVHGAIGTTIEHELQDYTKPVLAWRCEFGSMRFWDEYLTRVAVDAGRDVWALVSDGTVTELPT